MKNSGSLKEVTTIDCQEEIVLSQIFFRALSVDEDTVIGISIKRLSQKPVHHTSPELTSEKNKKIGQIGTKSWRVNSLKE